MNSFTYFAPTEIVFGCGVLEQLPAYIRKYGSKALLVTDSDQSPLHPLYERVKALLKANDIPYVHFDQVIPNPTTCQVSQGAAVAKANGVDVVVGIGGGSSMDTAKAIAVEATHPGTAWDYLHYTAGPTEKTLPILAVSTTAGTGSQTTPCAVITNTEKKDKSAIWNKNIFPKVAIVDPELTATMPKSVTAQTGFDAFCHNFEAYRSVHSNPLVEIMALEAISILFKALPAAYKDGTNMEARSQMAWVDTLGGLTNASAGVTLPHGLGMQVGGHCPHVTHGQALAAIYPEFLQYTMPSAMEKFAKVGRIVDPSLAEKTEEEAAQGACKAIVDLLKSIDLYIDFESLGVTKEDLREIADCGQVLGDYKNNPRVATIPEMYELLLASYKR